MPPNICAHRNLVARCNRPCARRARPPPRGVNAGDSPFAGAITAALFLADFVDPATRWLHLDIMAWNSRARPGRPEGGEALAIRALYALVAEEARGRRGKASRGRRPEATS